MDYAAVNSLQLNGSLIRDAVGRNANLTLPAPSTTGSLGHNKNLIINGLPGSFIIAWATRGSSQVTLDWTKASTTLSYTIKRGTVSGSYPTTVSTNATAPFTDTGLTNGIYYYYMITAVNNVGLTHASAEVYAAPSVFTADAGPDKTAAAAITLIGNDPAGAVAKQWLQVSGPGTITFGTPAAKNTTVSANTAGTYVVRYRITDSSNVSAQDDMTLVWDQSSPTFTSLDLINAGTNAEIDRVESRSGESVVANLSASNYANASYLLTGNAYACNAYAAGAYRSPVPTARDFTYFTQASQYKVCTRLEQANGNVAFGSSSAITRETIAPGSDPKTVKKVAAGNNFTCAILSDDSVRCWGYNAYGNLGYDTYAGPFGDVNGDMANLAAVNLGSGRTAREITSGGFHSCVVLDDDSLKCWGRNQYGQLGYDDTSIRGNGSAPFLANTTSVNLGIGRTPKAMSLGYSHTCVILDDDTVKCWGRLNNVNLGGSTSGSMAALTTVNLGVGRTAKFIASGDEHVCAILDTDAVKCWGNDSYGQLGYSNPTINLGAGRTAKSIAAGGNSTCAILDNDTVKCWGQNSTGQLGYNNTTNYGATSGSVATLAAVNLGTGRTAKHIKMGGGHTCAILDDDALKCWGSNWEGQLGYDEQKNLRGDSAGSMASLTNVNLGSGRTARALALGGAHTCAILDNDTLKCWGDNGHAQLGYDNVNSYGNTSKSMAVLPTINVGSGRTVKQIIPSESHTCAILDDDNVKCWGSNTYGQLGYNDTTTRGDTTGSMAALGVVDLGVGRTAKFLALGDSFTCAILDDDTVKCWGKNTDGQLGADSTTHLGTAASPMSGVSAINLGSGHTAKSIAAGGLHACAILDNDTIKCWGNNSYGQLGIDSNVTKGNATGSMATLSPINLGSSRTAKAIAAGSRHTCALLDNDSVKCWGSNTLGQLGYGDTTSRGDITDSMARLINIDLGNGRTAKSIATGESSTCVVLDDDTAKCWGYGHSSGYNTSSSFNSPRSDSINVGSGRKVKSIVAGDAHACAVLDDSTLKCWGGPNFALQLGYDDGNGHGYGIGVPYNMATLPAVNVGLGHWVKVVGVGPLARATCAILDDDTAKCWGNGANGMLGYDDTKNYGGGTPTSEAPPVYFP